MTSTCIPSREPIATGLEVFIAGIRQGPGYRLSIILQLPMQNNSLDPGLTNVTRSLAINAYLLWEVRDDESTNSWFESLEQRFCADRLSIFVSRLSQLIGTRILSVSSTSYKPYGASAALLVGQEQHFLAHLDASHIAAHSYFEASEQFGQFRLEIEISTCGSGHPQILIGEGLPNLAREDLDASSLRFEGYELDFHPAPERGGSYVELVRTGLRPVIDRAVNAMRK